MRALACALAVLALGSSFPGLAFAQWPNVRVSSPSAYYPEEVVISINPENPLNLAAGANIFYYYYSMDGGYTWTEGELTSSYGVYGDPSVTFDALGNLFFAHLSNPPSPGGDWLDRIVVQKSVDGGMTWDDGVGVGLNPPKEQDKEWITADMTGSVYHNNLYMAWTEFDDYGSADPGDSTRILFSYSTDHGATWAAPICVSNLGGSCADGDATVEGAVPAVGPDGEVYLTWAGHGNIYFDKSLDGGVTWGEDTIIAQQAAGWEFDVPGIYRCNGFPVTACDVSNSPFRGHLYVVYTDQPVDTTDTDIFFVQSPDGGATWSWPRQILAETGPHHQFFPWAAIDPADGSLYVDFYDRRYVGGDTTEVFLAMSHDGGATWRDYRVSESPFFPVDYVFFGDYIGIAARDGMVYPIWTRMDGDFLSVWVALVDIPTVGVAGHPTAAAATLHQNHPNPFNPTTTIRYATRERAHVSLRVYNVAGALVRTLVDEALNPGDHDVAWDGRNNAGEPVSSGVYFYRLVVGDFAQTRKTTLLK